MDERSQTVVLDSDLCDERIELELVGRFGRSAGCVGVRQQARRLGAGQLVPFGEQPLFELVDVADLVEFLW